ncbi:Nitrogen assimilation transcription factor nit-4 [Fusarium oxysporum f. sp. raphani]|uniref:Nitrogen assimilation transcription factor nit-4 n=1 Tax=Fusarium oxysporum f. sp. raphani TaxID=96318 RepID=A0A8J5QAR0_FUSOX|nr:Nitrogen assimilation transcription factor nit-4 [Fusarium oxysporum f. sp. raphani]
MSSRRPSLSDKGLPLNVSEFRRLLPAPVSDPEGTSSGSDRGPSLPSRLHPRTNQTKIACEPCRKRKAKCFGERPKCSACINRGLECNYQASNRDPRVLERMYDEVQEKASMYEQFCHLLGSLPERESNGILRRLREGADAATIMRQVKDGDLPVQTRSMRSHSHAKTKSRAKRRPGSSQSQIAFWAENMQTDHMSDGLPRYYGLNPVFFTLNEPEAKLLTQTWTAIADDMNLVQHLLALYFCWEYPTLASLSKEHFLRDFRDGRHRYCSPLLVNALLALGCRFSTRPMTRANAEDSHSAGDHFFKESQRLLDQETDHHSLTTIQALGIMSIREASCGRGSESRYYAGQSIQLAFEMGLHRTHDEGDQDELAVRLATFWGAFSLDHVYSLATGSLPQCSCFPHLPSKPIIIGEIEASLWVPYTDDGASLQLPCEQPSNERSSLYLMHSPGKPLTAQCLLSTFTEYLNWYDGIPDILRLGQNFTPTVLFVHMYYQFAILQLFRPLIRLRIIESQVSPRDVCLEAASAIQGLLTSYSQLYTLKRVPSFMPYFALTSSITHVTIMAATVQTNELDTAARADPHVSEVFKQGIASLAEMTPCHHIAEQAPHILCYLAEKWNIDVDVDTGAALNPEEHERIIKPFAASLNAFVPTMFVENSIFGLGMGKDVEETTSHQLEKAAESVEDPLFWPFLMQRRLMLSKGKELEEAGFAVL